MRDVFYKINDAGFPRTCLPVDLDTTDFIDVTTTVDLWAKYLDVNTGKVHDCAEYYKASLDIKN